MGQGGRDHRRPQEENFGPATDQRRWRPLAPLMPPDFGHVGWTMRKGAAGERQGRKRKVGRDGVKRKPRRDGDRTRGLPGPGKVGAESSKARRGLQAPHFELQRQMC